MTITRHATTNQTLRICAHGGVDIVNGNWGPDEIYGGDKRDIVRGGPGNDVIYGESGWDRLFGGPGADCLDATGVDLVRSCRRG